MSQRSAFELLDTQLNQIDKFFDKTAGPVYLVSISIIYFIYITTFLGLTKLKNADVYINYLDWLLQSLIAIYLILRFLPFRRHELHKHDAMIIFGSGIFLLTNLGLKAYLTKFIDKNVKYAVNSVEKQIHIHSDV